MFPTRRGEPEGFLARIAIVACLAALCALSPAAHAQPRSDQEIQFLIASVESLRGASFLRNGSSYDPATAADHLRLKLKNAGAQVTTAEDFIRLCASKSSVSGKPYEIRFADGQSTTTEQFLKAKLAEFRRSHATGSLVGSLDVPARRV